MTSPNEIEDPTGITHQLSTPEVLEKVNEYYDKAWRDNANFRRELGMEEEDLINNPSHYQSGKMETIEVIEAFDLGFHLGNVVKYILRADKKGCRLENLKKARWYLNREIENAEEE